MVFLLLISFTQMFLLPGVLFFQIAKIKSTPAIFVFICFSFSLIFNYALSTLFCLLGIYCRPVLLAVIFAELLACFILRKRLFVSLPKFNLRRDKIIYFFFIAALFFIYVFNVLKQVPKIFVSWDSVVSWNRWATLYSNGNIPKSTYHYPLALPAQWSICYVLCDAAIEYLPKATIPLFLYSAVFLAAEYAFFKKKLSVALSAVLILACFYKTGYVHRGYADIPVSSVAFGSFLLLFFSIDTNRFATSCNSAIACASIYEVGGGVNYSNRLLYAASFFCAASPLIKQAGLFAAAAFPAFVILLALKNSDKTQKIRFSLFYALFFLLTSGIFYIAAQILIAKGINHSEVDYVTSGIYYGKPVYKRFLSSVASFLSNHKAPMILGIPFIFANKDKKITFAGIFGLAYFLLWACFFCYDERNGFLSWPFIMLSETVGAEDFLIAQKEKLLFAFKFVYTRRNKIFTGTVVFVVFCSIALSFKFTKERFLAKQELAKIHRGGKIAKNIEAFYIETGSKENFLSNFQLLAFISDKSPAKQHYVGYMFIDIHEFESRVRKDKVKYFCILDGDPTPEFKKYTAEQIQKGNFKVLFGSKTSWQFIEISSLD